VQRVKRKSMKQREAGELLGLTERQVKRLCKLYQEAGGAAAGFRSDEVNLEQSIA
jgi:hypothetical protein